MRPCFALLASAMLVLGAAPVAAAWEFAGSRTITLHPREGAPVAIGTVSFEPKGQGQGFTLHMDHARFKDFFLSMKEFKCLESAQEIQCHVPYPYPNPATVSDQDLRWLEHSLLFLYKAPKDFGAKLWNGLYYRLEVTDTGLVGTPEAVDLNMIGAPPEDPSLPPYTEQDRSEINPASRWFSRLTIE